MLAGVWLPIITPLKDGRVDLASYRGLIERYLEQGISGLVPLGTTGESPTLDEDEADVIVKETVHAVGGRIPVFVGIGGNATHKVIKTVKRLQRHDFPGIVSVCPYYNRPTQEGLLQHFRTIADATDRQILVYNIPYRTSVNLSNETLLRLAERPNIVGVKDSSGSITQSLDLLASKPVGFSVLTGEDALLLPLLCSGADGGMLASSHIATDRFVAITRLVAANNHSAARSIWVALHGLIAKLFQEANPMPIKYCLWRQGLIASPECRSPLTSVSSALAAELDRRLGLLAREAA
jgi:4-hydroxy-tetrahydrodipicolinate synthase